MKVGRYKMFNSKHTFSFCVEESDWISFLEKCNELGLTPSEVLREFVRAFSGAEVKHVERRIALSVSLNITKVERQEPSGPSSLAKKLLEEEMLLELQDFVRRTKHVVDSLNITALYDRKRYLLKMLKQVKDIPPELATEIQGLLERFNERIAELRRA
ncbi:MAG: hypothetical protein ACXQTI_02695 [Candidatus Nezhaarchaeales archaeon]